MRRVLLFAILTVVILISVTLTAQTTRKPFFPVPPKLETLSTTASLDPSMKAAIAEQLQTGSCKLRGAEKYSAAEVDLKHEGPAIVVRVQDACLCDAGGNCPMYVFRQEHKGESKLVLHDAQGFAFALIPNPKGGDTPELLIASHTSANVTSLQRYRWKGGRFKLQDCEAAVRKEDAQSSWNPEELEVAGCDAIALR